MEPWEWQGTRFRDPDVILRRLESALLNERQWEKKRTTDEEGVSHSRFGSGSLRRIRKKKVLRAVFSKINSARWKRGKIYFLVRNSDLT